MFGIKSKLLGIRDYKLHEKDQEKKKQKIETEPLYSICYEFV